MLEISALATFGLGIGMMFSSEISIDTKLLVIKTLGLAAITIVGGLFGTLGGFVCGLILAPRLVDRKLDSRDTAIGGALVGGIAGASVLFTGVLLGL